MPLHDKTAQSGGGGDGGFWSKISDTFGEGIGKIGSDVLPRWANNQINGQKKNKLNQDTINRNLLPPSLSDFGARATNTIKQNPAVIVALIGAGIIALVVILRIKR